MSKYTTKDQIAQELVELVSEVLTDYDGEVTLNASLVDTYGVNSVSIIRIIVAAESKFDVEFTDYELSLEEYDTINDIAAVIANKLEVEE